MPLPDLGASGRFRADSTANHLVRRFKINRRFDVRSLGALGDDGTRVDGSYGSFEAVERAYEDIERAQVRAADRAAARKASLERQTEKMAARRDQKIANCQECGGTQEIVLTIQDLHTGELTSMVAPCRSCRWWSY